MVEIILKAAPVLEKQGVAAICLLPQNFPGVKVCGFAAILNKFQNQSGLALKAREEFHALTAPRAVLIPFIVNCTS